MPFVYPILPYKLKMAVYKRGNSWTVQVSWYITVLILNPGKRKNIKLKVGSELRLKQKNEKTSKL